jgi:uncharacterized protein (DUF433 family)
MTTRPIPQGIGIYSQVDAALLLQMTPSRLRRWVNGYTYWLRSAESAKQQARPPVIHKSDLPVLDGRVALSFLELMELRVVKALVDTKGVPLQAVRKAAAQAGDVFGTPHPFASRRVFTENRRIFASLHPGSGPEVIELTRGRNLQVVLGELIPLLEEVEFDEPSSLAHRWWPLTKSVPVVLDPGIMFGAPIMAGTRVRTSIAAEMARKTAVDAAAAAFAVGSHHIAAAIQFEDLLAAA